MKMTIKEMARISGYSPATISRVISNNGYVKETTRKEIIKLLEQCDYRTNVMNLRDQELNNRTILIIVGDLDNNYYMKMIQTIKRKAAEKDFVTLIAYSDNDMDEEEKIVRMASKYRYAGIIFMNVCGSWNLRDVLSEISLPVVFLNRGIPNAPYDMVIGDNYQGGYTITSYLIELGHKRIGHLMGSNSEAANSRCKGYKDAMKNGKLFITEKNIAVGNLDIESGYDYGVRLVKEGLDYTAVFFGNDLMAIGFVDAMKDCGVRVPDDISVVCYDDTIYTKSYGLTTVGVGYEKIGNKAVEILTDRIEDRKKVSAPIIYRPKITKRKSVKDIGIHFV